MPKPLYSNATIRQLEQLGFDEYGISQDEMMARAGQAAFDVLQQYWPNASQVVVVCGAGNNGGDGYVVARLLAESGLQPLVFYLKPVQDLQGAARNAADACQAAGVNMLPFSGALPEADVIVDGLLGTGLESDVRGEFVTAIEAINQHPADVLALDVPSGINSDTGVMQGYAVQANVTVTFIGLKRGLLTGDAVDHCGLVQTADLSLPTEAFDRVKVAAELLDDELRQVLLQPRCRTAHKGDFGHVLVIGGDYGFAGAARMAAEAAARVGAGLTSVATRPEHVTAISGARPELMCHAVLDADDLKRLLQRATVVAIGPGLGQSDWAQRLLDTVVQSDVPMVVDADALNLLAKQPLQREHWVLTPHPGEAGRLLGDDAALCQADRFAAAATLQQRYGGVVVLKGAGTVVQADGITAVNITGNPGMACGGMGDVLTGVIAGLLAQGLSPMQAASLGVYLHGCAADCAVDAGERGLLALDLMPVLRELVNPHV